MINESIVLDYYLKCLDHDEISFLKGRKWYKQAIRNHIVELSNSQNMHDKIQIAKNLWKSLFEASMTHIDPDKRGYDDLFKFFDEYVEFEELIFASDAFYRDHTIHCLWVYFLGEYLYRKQEYKFIIKDMFDQYKNANTIYEDIKKVDKPYLFSNALHLSGEFNKISNYGDSLRCLAALTHDLGYPLKKIRKINNSISKILPYFSIENFNEFDFNFNNTQMMFVKDFLEYMSMYPKMLMQGKNEEDYDLIKRVMVIDESNSGAGLNIENINQLNEDELKRLRRLFTVEIQLMRDVGKFLRYSNDFENHEHGILSAFLLMKTLGFFRSVSLQYSATDNIQIENINIYKVFSGVSILSAISDHTSKGYQIEAINDISSLLTIVDELEEFSRISRANKNREYINEFCRTDIYAENDVFNVDFIFENAEVENLDPEIAFKGRCKKLLMLLNISKLDEDFKLRLRCIGNLPKNKNIYSIEIRKKFANITINHEEINIPQYLKSKEFYTKEEYMNL